jgi:hypothetical protein
MKFQRRSPVQPARSVPPVDLERKRRAEELSTRSGIPLQMAYSVVDGHTSLDAVLKGMLAREKTRKLSEQYGLPPSLAGQVARGQVPLDKVLARHRRRTSAQWRARFSVFDALAEKSERIALLRFGQDWTEGIVSSVGKYDFQFDAGDGAKHVLKHEVKLILQAPDRLAAAREALSSDSQVAAKSLGATAELTQRVKLDKEQFFDAIHAGESIRFVFRDGDVIQGPVVWFARYEFALHVGAEHEIIGFFHGLLDWSVTARPEMHDEEARKPGKHRHDGKHEHRHDPKHGKKGGRKGHR